MGFLSVNIIAFPIVLLAGSLLWYRFDRRLEPAWRRWVTVAGLMAVWADLVLYVRWLRLAYGPTDVGTIGLLREEWGDIGLMLIVFGLIGAAAGKGVSRGVLALASVMGLFIWVVPGIL